MSSRVKRTDVDDWVKRRIDEMLPPHPDRHVAVKTSGLQHLVAHVDNRQPYFYNGLSYQVAFKRIAPGLYRAWFEVRP